MSEDLVPNTNSSPQEILPHFNLASLKEVHPSLLVTGEGTRVEHLFLGLALIFNDLKDVFWLEAVFGDYEVSKTINPVTGQYNGMRQRSIRIGASILHELLELLKEYRTECKNHEFEEALDRVGPESKEAWQMLLELTDSHQQPRKNQANSKDHYELRKGLKKVRDCSTYHYYQPYRLAKAFRSYFMNRDASDNSRPAYFSDGRNAEESRFYFADAATEELVREETDTTGLDFLNSVSHTLTEVNKIIKPLVIAFITIREEKRDHERGYSA